MECAENDGQGLGNGDRLSGHSRDDVLSPRTARAGLDAGDSGYGFGSRNRGVLTGQTGWATRLHEASQQERRWAHWVTHYRWVDCEGRDGESGLRSQRAERGEGW